MRVAAYLRVSDESQVEGYSLDGQLREISRWCERRGHELAASYREEGVSAHTERIDHRPQLSRLLDDARRGPFDIVVVHTLDRWARNVGVQRQALQRLGDAHVGFASVTEDIDFTTPSGKLMLTMIGGVSEFFSDQLSVHVKKGLAERARQGKANGDVPFGYRRCSDADGCPIDGHPGGVHVVEAEAEALREVFARVAAGGWSHTQAARWLNDHGFRTRNKIDRGRGAGPQEFTPWSVRGLLRNPFYTGVVRWGRESFPGLHEPIIDGRTFSACRSSSRRRTSASSLTRPYLLKGLLRCAQCGERYWAEQDGRRQLPYYRGARRAQRCACQHSCFRVEGIDARIGVLVYALQVPDEWLEQARRYVLSPPLTLDRRRKLLDQRMRRLVLAWVDGAFTEREYLVRKAAIQGEIDALRAPDADDGGRAADLLASMETLWRAADVAERSRILTSLLDAVYVTLDGEPVGIAPKDELVPLFASLTTRPETGVSLAPAPFGGVETGGGRTQLHRIAPNILNRHVAVLLISQPETIPKSIPAWVLAA